MFRESDFPDPRPHPTYTNKHKPVLQVQSQGASLTYYNENAGQSNREESALVPTTWSYKYDPNHPDADYAGLVDRDSASRRLIPKSHRAMTTHIVPGTAGGLTGSEQKKEYTDIKKIPPKKDPRDDFNILGGIGADDANRFKTTYQRQTQFEGTDYDQLTIEKRLGSKKQLNDPAQAKGSIVNPMEAEGSSAVAAYGGWQPETRLRAGGHNGAPPHAVVGTGPSSTLGKSLVSGLASKIAFKIEPSRSVVSREVASQRDKTMLLENYNTKPGFTGVQRK
jgi:hypothetical protein